MKRIGIIGAGTMGRTHASAYKEIPNAQLVAVCDANTEVAQNVAQSLGVEAYTNVSEMLSGAELDVVDVCTPTTMHLELIKAAAAAGKHVCCEKPLGRSVAQAQEAVRVCREAGVTLFVAHVLRWFPEFRKLHDLIIEGAIGDPVMVRTSRGGAFPASASNWFNDEKQSGGVVLDLIIHDFDWLRWCFGNVDRVYARGLYGSGTKGADYALVTLKFRSGVIAHVEGSWARPSGFSTSVEAAGTQGLLHFNSDESAPLKIERKAEGETRGGVLVPESPTSVNPYYRELEHFINCLEDGMEPEVRPEDGLEAVRIADAAIRSITSGQPVAL